MAKSQSVLAGKTMAEDPKHGADPARDPKGAPDPEALDRQRVLGDRLKTLFSDIVEEPVPDDFLDLLDKLDQGEGRDANARS